MKRICTMLLSVAMALSLALPAAASGFSDIPANSSLAGEIEKASAYGLMGGYTDTKFGYADPMTRAQFVTVVGRMMGWFEGAQEDIGYVTEAMNVRPEDVSETYFKAINAAAGRDVIDRDTAFRPKDPITRGEMAELLVRALGYKSAAQALKTHGTPFTDLPAGKEGYIAVAYAIGMTKGVSATEFAPSATATRAQAAAMMVRIYEKLHKETEYLHGFYAISSSGQLSLTAQMDSVSAGWSRMVWDGTTAKLATTSANGNEYFVPSGYTTAVDAIAEGGAVLQLSVFMDNPAPMLASVEGRAQAVEQIVNELSVPYKSLGHNPYSGVTIDFEGLRSGAKADFNAFLTELSAKVHAMGKTLSVCVSPVLTTGSYYDGYDYPTIGSLADKVILMAYDYPARTMEGFVGTTYHQTAALTPIDQIFTSLRAITDSKTGVQDTSKLVMGFCCRNVAWQIDEAGRLISAVPVYPSNDTVSQRLAQADTVKGWSETYQSAYATYTTEDGSRFFLWYEDNRSIAAKMDLAKLMGITGASIWRLGIVPAYDNWNWSSLLR